jgi:hypothetical protein
VKPAINRLSYGTVFDDTTRKTEGQKEGKKM